MKTPLMKYLVLTCGLVVGSAVPVAGQVHWNWSFGSEQGTFVTDGSFADTGSPGNFTISGFEITASAYPSHVGADTYETQPPQGFLWDGSAPTQFWRLGGTYTNGADFFLVSNDWYYVFNPVVSGLYNSDEDLVFDGSLTLEPVADLQTAIPTLSLPMTVFFSLLLAFAGFWFLRRHPHFFGARL